tara:strand:- start:135 stop:1001 length:867 start_codon:yes stop_codon:yes gene_type:complete
MKTEKDLTVIIVLYDTTEIIFACLKNLSKFQIIIVDNGKNKKILHQLRNFKNIKKIVTKNKNIGFGNAINYAYSFINTDYFLILNPDVIINKNSIMELLNVSINNKDCAISAPYIYTDKDGYGALPEKGKGIFRNNNQKKISEKLINLKPSGALCVDVTKGCAMLINSKHFKNIGMFSSEYFLFWEEIDLCRKFLKKKLSIIVSPKSLAFHAQGTSAKNNLWVFLIRTYYAEKSPLYYFKVKKNSLDIYKKMIKYFFRSISYLCILNLRNSLKNILKFSAILIYIIYK